MIAKNKSKRNTAIAGAGISSDGIGVYLKTRGKKSKIRKGYRNRNSKNSAIKSVTVSSKGSITKQPKAVTTQRKVKKVPTGLSTGVRYSYPDIVRKQVENNRGIRSKRLISQRLKSMNSGKYKKLVRTGLKLAVK